MFLFQCKQFNIKQNRYNSLKYGQPFFYTFQIHLSLRIHYSIKCFFAFFLEILALEWNVHSSLIHSQRISIKSSVMYMKMLKHFLHFCEKKLYIFLKYPIKNLPSCLSNHLFSTFLVILGSGNLESTWLFESHHCYSIKWDMNSLDLPCRFLSVQLGPCLASRHSRRPLSKSVEHNCILLRSRALPYISTLLIAPGLPFEVPLSLHCGISVFLSPYFI